MKESDEPPKPKKRKKPKPRVRKRQNPAPEAKAEAVATEKPVGYGNPPVHSRWIKGQSGNPAGKKKGTKNLKTIIYETSQKEVTLTIQGQATRMPLIEVVANKLWEKAAQGDIKAFQTLSPFIQQVERELVPPAMEFEKYKMVMIRFLATCAVHDLDPEDLALKDYEFDLDIAETAVDKFQDALERNQQLHKRWQQELEHEKNEEESEN